MNNSRTIPTASGLSQKQGKPTIGLNLIWLLVASSSIVLIEPAPYDLLALFLCISYFAFGLRIPPGIGVALFLWGVFLLANILSAIFAPDPVQTLRYMFITSYLVMTWVFFTSVIYDNPKRLFDIIWNGYVIAALLAALLGILAYFRLIPFIELFLGEADVLRVRGPFKDPNVFGPFLIPVAIYLIYKLENVKFGRALVTSGFLLIMVLGVLLSFSRGAWVNLFVSGFLYFCMRLVTSQSKADISRLLRIAATISILFIAVTVSAVSNQKVGAYFYHRAVLLQYYDQGTTGRFHVLRVVLYKAFLNPIGAGPGGTLDPDAALPGHVSQDPHNLYIHILAETGWLGGIAFCGFLLLTLWRGFFFCLQKSELQGLYIVVFACVVGVLIEGLVVHSTHWRHLYLLLAMLWGPIAAKDKYRDTDIRSIRIQ